MNTACYFSGIACYHRNEISLAEKHFTSVVDNIYLANGIVGIQCCFALSLIYQNQGHARKAWETAEKAEHFARELQSSHFLMWAGAFKSEIDLLQGRMDQVQHWADQVDLNLFRSLVWFFYPPLTLVKVRLAQGTTESLRQATDLLDHLDDFVVSIHNTRFRIDILALQALLNDCLGHGAAALKKLTESLTLAEPGGFLRNYVDLGPPMAELLKRMRDQHPAGDYVEKILASFGNDKKMVVPETTGRPSPSSHRAASASSPSHPLMDPLTNRELDVLELLARRLQNKEIAEKLLVSTETVKAHLQNIYQKLNVHKRREAVDKAKKLKIL